MSNNILMITYFFDEKDGVGSLRSKTLNKFLNKNNISTRVVDKKFFGEIISKSFILWCFAVFLKILFSKEKKVYISCGPFQHLIFVALASFLGRKKLIIDFRDPWSLNIRRGYNKTVKVNKLKFIISSSIERLSYIICDTFIVCTQGMYNEYKYLFRNEDKLVLMTNGHDVNLKLKTRSIDLSNLNVVCLGKFAEYDEDKARCTLNEVKNLVPNIDGLVLHFIGSKKDINIKVLDDLNLRDKAIFYPRMEYREALEIASKCDLGMLIMRDEDIEYGTKVFDYIGLGLLIVGSFNNNSIFKDTFKEYIYSRNNSSIKNVNQYKRNNIYLKNIKIFS